MEFNMIEVVNVKTCKDVGRPGDVYIGRRNENFPESKWANPFPIGKCIVNNEKEHFTRDGCIVRFEKYIVNGEIVNVNRKIYRGDLAKDALKELKYAKRLVCYCFPLNCHGNIIIKILNSYDKNQQSVLNYGD